MTGVLALRLDQGITWLLCVMWVLGVKSVVCSSNGCQVISSSDASDPCKTVVIDTCEYLKQTYT